MSLLQIVQTVGLLECCGGRQGKYSDTQKRSPPDGVGSSECILGSKERRAGGVGIKFHMDKTGALIVKSLMPQGTIN
jgi:hypothetical protein